MLLALGLVAAALIFSASPSTPSAQALVNYPPAALLQPGDITAAMIRDGQIGANHINTSSSLDGVNATSGTPFTTLTNATQTLYGQKIFNAIPQIPGITNAFLGTDGSGNLTSKSVNANATVAYTAGAYLNTNDAVALGDGTGSFQVTSTAQDSSTSTQNQGSVWFMQTFKTGTTTVSANSVNLYYNSGLGGIYSNPTVYIFATDGTYPTGTAIGSGGCPSQNGAGFVTCTLTTTSTLQASTTYALEVNEYGGSNNYMLLYYKNVGTYANGQFYSGGTQTSTWTAVGSADLSFAINGSGTIPGLIYQASAASGWAPSYNNFLGFAAATTSPGSSVTITVNGVLNTFSGLTLGTKYYLSNTAGGISTSAGTNSLILGFTTDTSTLIIKHNNF